MSRDTRFQEQAQALGYSFDGEIKIGGNYVPLVRDGHHIYLSGQIPRVGDKWWSRAQPVPVRRWPMRRRPPRCA